MSLDFSRCRLTPFQHQKEDTQALIDHPFFFITSEMRTGKTAIVIWAAQFLFEMNVIDRVLVVAPAPVRDVWYDPDLGEIAKHRWKEINHSVHEFHARLRMWKNNEFTAKDRYLQWGVTNFEFIRSGQRLKELLPFCGQRTLLVGDESSFLKNHAARQTKAFLQLRRACGRVVLLNGTPLYHSPMDLFSQGNILSPSILDCKFVTYYRAKYAVQESVRGAGGKVLTGPGGQAIKRTVGWTNLDDLQRRFAPYTVRRLQAECLDLPPKLDPVTLTATLTPEVWKIYKEMRDEMVVWLRSGNVATSATAAAKAMRLSQITGGFLGGVEDAGIDGVNPPGYAHDDSDLGLGDTHGCLDLRDDVVLHTPSTSILDDRNQQHKYDSETHRELARVQEVGREKLDVLLWFIKERLEADPNLHLVTWFRFRAETFRALAEVQKMFPQFECATITGGQKRDERLRALALLKPETSPKGPVFVAGVEGTGSFGLDMTAAHTCVTMSSGYSPGKSAQTLDRVFGPGQTEPIAYYSVLAVGPRGQRTIDHQIEVARRGGENVATWTASAWIKALTSEE